LACRKSSGCNANRLAILKRDLRNLEESVASFEELKAKYQSVLDVVQQKQVHMANLHMQDGKLFMKGTAPSQEAANAVWDAIKKVNPKADDIAADFPIDTNLQGAQRTYTVKAGDTLSKISKQFF